VFFLRGAAATGENVAAFPLPLPVPPPYQGVGSGGWARGDMPTPIIRCSNRPRLASEHAFQRHSPGDRTTITGNLIPMMEISNSGNASAHDIFVECSHNGKDAFPKLPDPWLINRSHWKVIEYGIDRLSVMALVPLHPSHSLPFIEGAAFFVRLRNKIPDLCTSPLLLTFSDLRLTLNVYARDAAPARYSASFSEQDFDDANSCVKECEIVD
jgi:hypothetical protein